MDEVGLVDLVIEPQPLYDRFDTATTITGIIDREGRGIAQKRSV